MYFDGKGPNFTSETAKLAVERAKELGIDEFVVASNMGPSAWAVIEALGGSGKGVTAVTHSAGWKEPFKPEMADSERQKLIDAGAAVVTTAHAFSGVARSLNNKLQGPFTGQIIADTLRLFGQGMKVAVECALMAADAGTLKGGRIIAIGGSGRGCDTAIVMSPGHTNSMFDQVKIHEVICKPAEF